MHFGYMSLPVRREGLAVKGEENYYQDKGKEKCCRRLFQLETPLIVKSSVFLVCSGSLDSMSSHGIEKFCWGP